MKGEIYSDGICEITVTGAIVRIDLMSLSPTERDADNNPKPVFRRRIVMPLDAFANSTELMRKAVNGLAEAGAIKQTTLAPVETKPAPRDDETPVVSRIRNVSPNFST